MEKTGKQVTIEEIVRSDKFQDILGKLIEKLNEQYENSSAKLKKGERLRRIPPVRFIREGMLEQGKISEYYIDVIHRRSDLSASDGDSSTSCATRYSSNA
jgi:hypothetical protein